MRMEILLSDLVWVMLTKEGEKALDEYVEKNPVPRYPVLPSCFAKDLDGWCRFRLWQLMEIFGTKLDHHAKKPLFVGNIVHFIQPGTYCNKKQKLKL